LFPTNAVKENVMRRVVLILAALAVLGLAATTAEAGQRYRAYPGGPAPYGGYYGGYVAPGGYGYGFYGGAWSYGYNANPLSFEAAASRVRAKYSPYRYNPHPRSYYKSGPSPYDLWPW
jgi:hypothetical protein